jgi:sugar lactone lactonase YvrE
VYIDDDQTIYVTDCGNDRIVEWKCGANNGQVVAGGNGHGNETNQLHWPRDVIVDKQRDDLIICDRDNRRVMRCPRRNGTSGQIIISNIDCWGLTMDNNGYLYVSDSVKHEVRRWKMNDTSGTLVAGGNGKGNRLNQLDCPTFIFVDQDHSVYVSDCVNDCVMKWIEGAKEGIIVAGGQGKGNGLTQLSGPRGVIVDHLGTVYVADCNNHRIMCWSKGAAQGIIVVGGNGEGEQTNQIICPLGLSFDRQGNLYVADCNNHRVQRFSIDKS